MRNIFLQSFMIGSSILFSLFLGSCSKDEPSAQVLDQEIKNIRHDLSISFPFADREKLKSLEEGNVVNFELARKIATIELYETGLMRDMGWSGHHLSELPILIYNLKSEPRYYDFVVFDAENKPTGIVRTFAKKERSTIIEGTYQKIPSYNELLSKSNNKAPEIFMDWKGEKFVGLSSKFGQAPQTLLTSTGEVVPLAQIQDLDDMQIASYMEQHILPDIIIKSEEKEKAFSFVPSRLIDNPELKEEIELSKNATIESIRDSMLMALERTQKEAEAYWNTLGEYEKKILDASEEELSSSSKFLGRIFRRIFSGVDTSRHYIGKYEGKKNNYRRGGWCGPWACGFIVYVNQGEDTYDFFTDCAATFGELAILNFALRLLGRPLTPVEMSWSMPIASKRTIWINPIPLFQDLCAYDQIKFYGCPALRLCSDGFSLHWTLAYGARQTGCWAWRNYYFLQIDNGAKVGIPGSANSDNSYQRVDWWNPWLMVWD